MFGAIKTLAKISFPEFLGRHLLNIDGKTTINAPLATEFANEPKTLIPVVFSHGLMGSRLVYSVLGSELASCGYIVFLLDHHDGSSCYTETEGGTPVEFDHN